MANIIEMPKLGFDMAEGTLISWVVEEGAEVKKGDVLAEIETDKATVEVESSYSGVLLKTLVDINTTLPVGTPIAVIGEEGEEVDLDTLQTTPSSEVQEQGKQAQEKKEVAAEIDIQPPDAAGKRIKASPLAKAMAKDKGIDLANIKGSGPGGRIVKRDIDSYAPKQPAVLQPAQIQPGEDSLQPLSKLRQIIGKRMQASKQSIPHFYVTYSYDVEMLMKMRKKINEDKAKEERVSVNDFIIKAVALALRKYPKLNASINEQSLMLHGDINIGNAVAVENGLLTVVCRNADQKPLLQISQEMREMVQRVRDERVSPTDIEGSTFTISNLGMYGVDEFSAIINPPETAILAVASAQQIPVVSENTVKPGYRMKATLSADHRASDGAEAALFMRELGSYLEQPWLLW